MGVLGGGFSSQIVKKKLLTEYDCQSIFQCFLCGEISHTGEVCNMAF